MAGGGGTAAIRGGAAAWPARRRRLRMAAARALLAAWAVAAGGCAGATEAVEGGRAPVLFVANGRDGTVSRFDAGSGAALGAPLPGGEAPWQLAVGPAGDLLILPLPTRPNVPLTHVARSPGGWRARPVPLEPGARSPLLAGRGRYAVVAYQAEGTPAGPAPARCRVAVFDFAGARLAAARDVCSGADSVVGLAVGAGGAGGAGALAYLAIWRRPAGGGACGGATGSRVVALRPTAGAPVAVAPLAGVPGPLVLSPGPGRLGARLYAAEALPAPDGGALGCQSASYRELVEGAAAWRVWGLDAASLAPEAEHAVPAPVRALAVTPDGDDAFVLADLATVLRLAPGGGPAARLTALPGPALGLAATDDRLYALDALGDRVWGLDRRRGTVVQTLATGRGPTGLVLAGR
jgi:hypothetical protein